MHVCTRTHTYMYIYIYLYNTKFIWYYILHSLLVQTLAHNLDLLRHTRGCSWTNPKVPSGKAPQTERVWEILTNGHYAFRRINPFQSDTLQICKEYVQLRSVEISWALQTLQWRLAYSSPPSSFRHCGTGTEPRLAGNSCCCTIYAQYLP